MKWIRTYKRWLILLLAVAVCGGGALYFWQGRGASGSGKAEELTATVKKGDIRSTVSGTSQLQPKETKIIQAPADAVVETMNLTRNMSVKKDDVLVVLKSAAMESNLQKAKATLANMEAELRDLEEQMGALRLTAPISGTVTLSNNIDVGVEVNRKAKIASIADHNKLTVTLPFSLEDSLLLHVGDAVDLTVDGFMQTKTGSVAEIGKDPKPDLKGGKLVDVTVDVGNDSTLDAGLKAAGTVETGGRSLESKKAGTLAYSQVVNLLSGVAGTVERLNVSSGDHVQAGQLISVTANDTIQNDYATKKSNYDQQLLTVQDLQEKLDELTIKAPFDGVFSTDFVDKKTNILASLTPGTKVTNGTQFGGIANTEHMLLPIQVDELDLPSVKVGLKADVKVDSLKNRTFKGEVTQVSTVGTTTNGVTYYDAVLTITETNGLKYGMTATGEILLQNKQNILILPIEALQSRGGKYYVSLKKADGTVEDQHEIKIGIRSKTQVEITEGLEEGQTVLIPIKSKTQTMTQEDIQRLRQQYQQGQNGQGGQALQLDPETIRQIQQNGGFGGGGGSGRTERANGSSGSSGSGGGASGGGTGGASSGGGGTGGGSGGANGR